MKKADQSLKKTLGIDSLAPELLIRVFTLIQEDPIGLPWLRILRVCKYWYTVASSAPELWTSLNASGNLSFLRTGLTRSKSLKIDVNLGPCAPHLLPTALDLLEPHVSRLSSLSFSHLILKHTPPVLAFLGRNAFPSMHFLRILTKRSVNDEHDSALLLPSARFPQLRTLECSRVHFFGDASGFKQLRTLKVDTCLGIKPRLKTTTLVNALLEMPHIEVLELHEVSAHDAGLVTLPPSRDTVALDNLRKLALQTESPIMCEILSRIVIPSAAEVSLKSPTVSPRYEADAHCLRDLLPADRNGLPILSCVTRARVVSYAPQQTLYGDMGRDLDGSASQSGYIHLSLTGMIAFVEDEGMGLGDFLDIFPNAPLHVLDLECTRRRAAGIGWPSLFALFPDLQSLRIKVARGEGGPPSMKTLFAALDPDSQSNATGFGLPCQHLENLYLTGYCTATDEVLRMMTTCLENRRQWLGGMAGGALSELRVWLVEGSNTPSTPKAREAAFRESIAPLVARCTYHEINRVR